jgi:small-conductance mechanosensitive channel
MTKEFSRYVFDVGVAYREDVDEVIAVMKEVDEEMRHDPLYAQNILEPLEILGLNEFGDSAVVVRARNKTAPGSQWSIGREYNRRLKKAFDARDIEIPFPHVTLYMGKDKEGEAPPLRLLQERTRRAASARPRRRK